MNPYREFHYHLEVKQARSKFKTKWLKFLIWWHGSWKKRHERCTDCGQFWAKHNGPEIDVASLYHYMFYCPKHRIRR